MYKCWFSSTPIRIPNTKKDHKNCDLNLLRSFWTPTSFFVDYPIFGVDSLCRLFFVQEKYTKKHFLKCIVSGSFCLQGIKLLDRYTKTSILEYQLVSRKRIPKSRSPFWEKFMKNVLDNYFILFLCHNFSGFSKEFWQKITNCMLLHKFHF